MKQKNYIPPYFIELQVEPGSVVCESARVGFDKPTNNFDAPESRRSSDWDAYER